MEMEIATKNQELIDMISELETIKKRYDVALDRCQTLEENVHIIPDFIINLFIACLKVVSSRWGRLELMMTLCRLIYILILKRFIY
ncbi:unnamed protein product [marine sediment metagenome]|uniref:Uncharacterized protein n=1 Tax=marine sediment metagenome TaxID=412755 RepID=X1G5N6_9ZZZZ